MNIFIFLGDICLSKLFRFCRLFSAVGLHSRKNRRRKTGKKRGHPPRNDVGQNAGTCSLLPSCHSLFLWKDPMTITMILSKAALALSLGCTAARAFSPAARGALSPLSSTTTLARSFGTTTALRANVLKLTQPSKDLLLGVDVFIFDCDGVIWRVSSPDFHPRSSVFHFSGIVAMICAPSLESSWIMDH